MKRSLDSFRLPPDWNPIKSVDRGQMQQDPAAIEHLNRVLVEIQQRLDTIQQVGATKPATPLSPSAQGRQGLIWLTWNRVVNVDGYSVVVATTSDMSKILHRIDIAGSESCVYHMPVGNVAFQAWFQVYSHRGTLYSTPSNVVTATSVGFAGAEAAPPAPPVDPRNPLRAPLRNGTLL